MGREVIYTCDAPDCEETVRRIWSAKTELTGPRDWLVLYTGYEDSPQGASESWRVCSWKCVRSLGLIF